MPMSTHHLRCCDMEIRDAQGHLLFTYDGDLIKANLDGVDLTGAILEKANLEGVAWCGTNLQQASLREANLYMAILFTSNLSRADLQGANLSGRRFEGGQSLRSQPEGCRPEP
ncbi:MAG: pentapeptide repeat-containing protein [Blastocatellia bacterium]